MADIPLLAAVLPRRLTFMAKEELWLSPVLRVLANWYQVFPAYRKAIDTTALRRSLAVLRREQALVVFPEGTRSLQHAALLPGQPGAALIALRSTAPVLPIAITGTEKAKGLSWLWNRPKLAVNIGRPFTLVRAKDKSLKHQLGVDTRTIMQNIASLLPPSYHGAYGR
jgi:1-acyl-sn-glycerol-3-phosphate acyltransferase